MADTFAFLIRFLHIFAGVMWVGGAFLWGMVLVPNVLKRGPPAVRRPFLEAALEPLARYLMIAGILTIVSGFWVMGILVGWDSLIVTFQKGGQYGMALGIGVVAALILFVVGNFVASPTARKMLKLMQAMQPGAAPPAEMPALAKRLAFATMTNLAVGTLALGTMAWAVNVVR